MISIEEITVLRDKLETELQKRFPFFRTNISTLGGINRASIMITLSLEPREEWTNGIKENSRHFNISIHNNSISYEVENTIAVRGLKMRSFTTMDSEKVVSKLNKFFDLLATLIYPPLN